MSDEPADPTPTVDHDSPTHVTVVGDAVAVVPVSPAEESADAGQLTSIEMGFSCDTGTSASGTWHGRPLASLLDEVELPAETTHIVLRAADGFQVCVPATTALDGVVATTLDGDPLDDAWTRFVAPGLESTRCIRDLAVVRAVQLAPGEDRGEYESIGD